MGAILWSVALWATLVASVGLMLLELALYYTVLARNMIDTEISRRAVCAVRCIAALSPVVLASLALVTRGELQVLLWLVTVCALTFLAIMVKTGDIRMLRDAEAALQADIVRMGRVLA